MDEAIDITLIDTIEVGRGRLVMKNGTGSFSIDEKWRNLRISPKDVLTHLLVEGRAEGVYHVLVEVMATGPEGRGGRS